MGQKNDSGPKWSKNYVLKPSVTKNLGPNGPKKDMVICVQQMGQKDNCKTN